MHLKHLAQYLAEESMPNNLCLTISDLSRFNFYVVTSRGRSHCALAQLGWSLGYFAPVYSELIREKFNLSNDTLLKFKRPWHFFGILSFVKSN